MSFLSESFLIAVLAIWTVKASGQVRIATAEAGKHVGEKVTVCGKVVSTRISKYKVTSRGRPIILNLDQPEPSPVFLVLTWPADSEKPGQAQESYQEKQVCVTGKIVKGRGLPEIIASEPSQIQLQPEPSK